jgi:DNA integrity scanning protein DisA with diadenylate cyclase activity
VDFRDNFRLQDAVDIGIVAFIVYSLIELIRGTRAARMLIGLSFVVLIYLSSRIFNL